jgi:integral membrane protein (TIGR01906 family)
LDGAPAFDESAVAHLEDVREVMLGARLLTGILAAVLAVWLVVSLSRKRLAAIATALFAGSLFCFALPLIGAAFALTDFEWFFALFHSLFFESGTWTFPYDALLIRLFPESFWATAGAAWAAGIVLGGVVLGLAGLGVRAAGRAPTNAPGRHAE